MGRAVLEVARQWRSAWGVALRASRSAGISSSAPPLLSSSPFDTSATELAASSLRWHPVRDGLWWALAAEGAPVRRWFDGEDTQRLSVLASAMFGDAAPGWSSARPGRPGRGALPSGCIAREIAEAAWNDWWGRVSASVFGECTDAPASAAGRFPVHAWEAWSGSLVFTIPWPEGSLKLLATCERIEPFLRPRVRRPDRASDLTPVWRAVALRKLRIHVETDPFELDVEALAGLCVGDVLQTTHAVDAPLIVRIDRGNGAAGEKVGAAFLGRMGAARAVDLRATRRPAASSAV